MIFLKFSLINKWRENQNNLYVMKIFILLIYQLFHLTSFSLSLRPLLTEVCIDLANWTDLNKVKMTVAQSCQTLCDPIDYTVHGILQARILEWVAVPFSRGSPQPRDWTQVACIAGGFFTSWTTREAQESLLQGIFPNQELNRGLLHCIRILYQLSYQGSPILNKKVTILHAVTMTNMYATLLTKSRITALHMILKLCFQH